MEEFALERTGRMPLTFTGEKLASVSTTAKQTGIAKLVSVFRTKGGFYVLRIIQYSEPLAFPSLLWVEMSDTYSYMVFEELDDLLTRLAIEMPEMISEAIIEQLFPLP